MLLPSIRTTYERVESFFLKSDLWIFATVMTMISLVLALEDEPYSLGNLLAMVVGYAIAFSPTYWFVSLRSRLKASMKKWRFRGLQAFVFCGYPFLLALGGAAFAESVDWLDRSYDNALIGTVAIGMSFFGTAVVLYGLLKSKWLPDVRKRVAGWLTPGVIATVFFVLASILTVAGHPDFQKAAQSVNDLVATGLFFGAVINVLLVYLPFALLFQLHHQLLYRKLLLQRGVVYYVVGGVAAMLSFAPLHGAYARLFPLTVPWELHTSAFKGGAIAPENFAITAGFLVFSIPVILFLEWVRKTRTITLLEKEKTDTELNLLKQQVNPHFFFNTLNNLYSLSLKSAPETPDTVLQLSELMRYVIYRAKEERVTLQEEIDYLRDYLDLQRIRLSETAEIDFVVDVENGALRIPPLLFIILVENAFKHGIEKATKECYLQLELRERGGEVTVICRNSVEDNRRDNGLSPGIGLGNLTRRLELLYPDAHSLKTTQTAGEYRIELTFWQAVTLQETELSLEALPDVQENELLV